MTNKKLWLSLLSIALIVCMLSVGLISCKPKEEPTPTPTEQVEVTAMKAIINGLKKSVEDGDMTDLKVDGNLGIKVNETQYDLSLKLDLDLLQKTESANTSNTFLEAELKKGNSTLLGVYYKDANPGNANIYTDNYLYVQYKPKDGDVQKMAFPAPYVAAVQNAKNGKVDFSNIDLQDEDIWEDTILKYALMVAALAEEGNCTDTSASLALNLGTLLDPDNEEGLADLVSGLVDFDALDLDADAGLVSILPNIKLVLSADLDNGKVTGLNLSLEIDKKNIEVKHKSNNKEVLVINIDKDITVELALEYTVGEVAPSAIDFNDYIDQENILDVALSVDLFLDSELGVSFDLNGKPLKIGAKPGYYTLDLNIAANPWSVIAEINATNGISFDGTANIIESIKKIINVVESLQIKLTKVKNVDGTALAEPDDVLNVLVASNYTSKGVKADQKAVFIISLDLVDGLGLNEGLVELDSVIDIVLGFIPKSGEAPDSALGTASTADDDDNTELFQTIAGYLLGAYLGINDGVTEHGKIFAKFDTNATTDKMIPFSGYTKWTGSTKGNFKYYEQTKEAGYDKVEASAQFDASKTYYTLTAAKFTKVDQSKTTFDKMKCYYEKTGETTYKLSTDTEFNSAKDYYVYEAEKYEEAKGITSFASGTTYYTHHDAEYAEVTFTSEKPFEANKYYVRGYNDITYNDKGEIVSRGDFGITLSATIKVDDNVEINATVGNMDIFGLPASLKAKISNLQIKLWSEDFNVLSGGANVVKYATVK